MPRKAATLGPARRKCLLVTGLTNHCDVTLMLCPLVGGEWLAGLFP